MLVRWQPRHRGHCPLTVNVSDMVGDRRQVDQKVKQLCFRFLSRERVTGRLYGFVSTHTLGMSCSTRGSANPEENGLEYNGVFSMRDIYFHKA